MAFSLSQLLLCVILSINTTTLVKTKCKCTQEGYTSPTTVSNSLYEKATSYRANFNALGYLVEAYIRKNNYNHTTNTTLTYICSLLLIPDIETNPGPRPTKFPCGVCNKAVRNGQCAVSCDDCDLWFHIGCQGMSRETYDSLIGKDFAWTCLRCGLPNLSTSFFDTSISSTNSFSPLRDVVPIAASSPRTRPERMRITRPLRILNVNCQSIGGKKVEFQQLIDETKPDVVCASETWLTQHHQDGEIGEAGRFSRYYVIHRKDRTNRTGGGVFVGIKRELLAEKQEELNTECESVWIKLTLKCGRPVYICSYYRPHVNDEDSLAAFRSALARIPRHNKVIIAGDLNFPDLICPERTITPGSTHNRIHSEFIDLLDDFSLNQMVDESTRNGKTLDLILTNSPTHCTHTEVISGISDHEAVLSNFNLNHKFNKQPQRKVPVYSKADWTSLAAHITTFHNRLMEQDISLHSADKLWIDFRKSLQEGIQKHIPQKTVRPGSQKPWINRRLQRMLRRKRQLFSKQKTSGKQQDIEAYKDIKRKAQKEMRQSYWRHVEDIVTPEAGASNDVRSKCSKRFWGLVKHSGNDSVGIPGLADEQGVIHEDASAKAEILNRKFVSVFSPRVQTATSQPAADRTSHPEMPEIEFHTAGISKLLCELDPYKACGPDQIKPVVLRTLHLQIAPILQVIFERSYETGIVPEEWRSAYITPIYKKGARSDPGNYRPVSLTCVASKVMEHVVVSSLMRHLDRHNILHTRQHGFRARRSCDTQLVEFTHDLFAGIQDGHQMDVIIMDFAKAFDKVSHNSLLIKLQRNGITGRSLAWIAAFLKDRTQQVVVDGARSERGEVSSGVPQGSVIAPALFLVFINDLPDSISSDVRLFADDTVVYRKVASAEDAAILQRDLDSLAKWEEEWQMQFHASKCQVLKVRRARTGIDTEYRLHGISLPHADEVKYLGVTISKDLKWNKHVANIRNKASSKLSFLQRNVKIGSPKLKEQLYQTLVRSNLEYASCVWDPHEAKLIKQLEMVQRRAARWVTNRYHNTSSVTDMLRDLTWQSLELRRTHSRLCMLYKLHHDLVAIHPSYTHLSNTTRHTRTSQTMQYTVYQPRTNYFKYSFFPLTIVQWNMLGVNIKCAATVNMFKTQVAKLEFACAQ